MTTTATAPPPDADVPTDDDADATGSPPAPASAQADQFAALVRRVADGDAPAPTAAEIAAAVAAGGQTRDDFDAAVRRLLRRRELRAAVDLAERYADDTNAIAAKLRQDVDEFNAEVRRRNEEISARTMDAPAVRQNANQAAAELRETADPKINPRLLEIGGELFKLQRAIREQHETVAKAVRAADEANRSLPSVRETPEWSAIRKCEQADANLQRRQAELRELQKKEMTLRAERGFLMRQALEP